MTNHAARNFRRPHGHDGEPFSKKVLKKLILVVLTIASAFFFWSVVKPWLADPFNWRNISGWLWPAVGLLVFLTLSGLVLLLVEERRWQWLALMVPLGLFVLRFGWAQLVGVGILIALLLQLSALRGVHQKKNNHLRFHLTSTLRSGIYRLITAILILLSFAYFLTPAIQTSAQNKELPPGISRTIQGILNSYLSEKPELQNPQLRAQVTREATNQLNTFLRPYYRFLPPLLAFSFYLILQGISFLLVWVTLLLSWLVWSVLKLLKIVTIKKVMREGEAVSF